MMAAMTVVEMDEKTAVWKAGEKVAMTAVWKAGLWASMLVVDWVWKTVG